MNLERIRHDMLYLAGDLPHRAALTDHEQRAADFLAGRFAEYTPDVGQDRFTTMDKPFLLFAAYYSEFLVVAILAAWWPRIALVYGGLVFAAYLAEVMGYRILARLMPPYHSQNVAARFLADEPRHLFIVTANYDSGRRQPAMRREALPVLRSAHFVVLACMFAVILSCALDALGVFAQTPVHLYLRWVAVGMLLSIAGMLFYSTANTGETRGANTNGSGVCALLQLAERFRDDPLPNADVWLVATGAQASWMSGMHHLLAGQGLDRAHTWVLNLECVGAGALHYLGYEAVLQREAAAPELLDAAEAVAPMHGARPAAVHGLPTGAHIAHARRFKALTVMGLDTDGLPANWHDDADTLSEVDEAAVANAAAFGESLLRRLSRDLP